MVCSIVTLFFEKELCMIPYQTTPPVVSPEACTGCSRCVSVCPAFVLDLIDGKSTVSRGDWCIGCGHCGAVCPTGAVFHPSTDSTPASTPPEGRENDFPILTSILRARRSVRTYAAQSVSQEVIEKVLDTGRYVPTGRNSQNVHYIVIRSSDEMKRLRDSTLRFYEKIFSRARGSFGRLFISILGGRKTAEYLRQSLPKMEHAGRQIRSGKDCLFYDAPVLILAHAESWDTCSPFNCAAALYHCSLTAHTLGLGSCFNGYLVNAVNYSKKIRRSLGMPADHKCYAAMTLGFPDVKHLRVIERQPARVTWR
jgi:ferredoxin